MSEDDNSFYVCVYFEEGKPVGHSVGLEPNFPEKLRDGISGGTAAMPKQSGLGAASKQFVNVMMGYLEYVPLILTMAPLVSHKMVMQSLMTFLESECENCEKSDDRAIYKFNRHVYPALRRFDENLSAAASTSRALPRLLTVGLVSSLEYHLTRLMREIAVGFPNEIFGKDKTVPTREIVKFSSIDELKEFVIGDEIDKIQRENIEAQVRWIVSKTHSDDFTQGYAEWPNIVELFERRNLFVHTNGLVSEQYIKTIEKCRYTPRHPVKVGDELHSGPDYYTGSVHRVVHFGALLLQVVWRKSFPEESGAADKAISDLGYELIARGRYKLAIKILESANELRGVADVRKRMNVVNLANAYKLSGDEKTSLEVLASMDWSAVGPEFKVSVASVKGEVSEAISLMKKIGKSGDVTAADYQQWPVFYSVREDTRFVETFKLVFGLEFVPSSRKQAGLAQVMEWAKDQKLMAEEGQERKTGSELIFPAEPAGGARG